MIEPSIAGRHGIDRLLSQVRHGRFERSLSGLTAVGALVTGAEIWMEHDRASFRQQDDVGARGPHARRSVPPGSPACSPSGPPRPSSRPSPFLVLAN